ncbi:MAG: putative peptidoglycan binding domain [Chthoniobacter sp.]|nr:putative peptidoglycan binding domain [Chthoniobacter sp.]
MVRSAQEELRRRNIFFGDIDGRQTPEWREALKRYQKRKGLATTGSEDHDTLRSLGLATRTAGEPPPKELEWPEEPVLKSDALIDVAAETEQMARETGVSPASIAPLVARKSSRDLPAGSKARPTSRASGAAAARPEIGGTRLSQRDSKQLPAEIRALVEDYLKSVSRNALENELHFYADQVDYLGNGLVDRRIIEQTLRKYYQRWPKRSYRLEQGMKYDLRSSRGEVVVTFRVDFSLKNGGRRVRGQTDNEIVINAATADPRIVAIRERRVRS